MTGVRTSDVIVSESIATRRFTLTLLALFAATALVLAVIGLYGALSYVVSQRQHEMGVRVALGARAADIMPLVLRQGMVPAAIGLMIGLIAAGAGSRVVASMLFGVTPTDAATFVLVALVLSIAALVACLIPARNASKVQPSLTLKAL